MYLFYSESCPFSRMVKSLAEKNTGVKLIDVASYKNLPKSLQYVPSLYFKGKLHCGEDIPKILTSIQSNSEMFSNVKQPGANVTQHPSAQDNISENGFKPHTRGLANAPRKAARGVMMNMDIMPGDNVSFGDSGPNMRSGGGLPVMPGSRTPVDTRDLSGKLGDGDLQNFMSSREL